MSDDEPDDYFPVPPKNIRNFVCVEASALAARDAEIAKLREALQTIIKRYETADDGWPAEDMREIASAALAGEDENSDG